MKMEQQLRKEEKVKGKGEKVQHVLAEANSLIKSAE